MEGEMNGYVDDRQMQKWCVRTCLKWGFNVIRYLQLWRKETSELREFNSEKM